MSLDSLYSDDIEAGIQRKIARPDPAQEPSFSIRSFLAAGMKGLRAGVTDATASVTDASAALGFNAAYASLDNTPEANAASKALREGAAPDYSVGNELRLGTRADAPDPATASTADQVLYGFTRVGAKVVAATSVGGAPVAAALLGAEGTNTGYRENLAKGIDPDTALKQGAVEGLSEAAAVIPLVGPTIKSTIALGAVAGPGAFMAQEALSKKILATAGYNDEASRHDPLDPLGLTIATLLPAAFGGVHALGLARAAKPPPTLADVVLGNESGGKRYGTDGQLLTSPKGAQGEMQVMPKTATDPGFGVVPARDSSPEELARVGRDYLDAMVHRYGSADQAMAAYNAGPGAVDKALLHGADWLSHLPEETQAYVAKGMKKLGDDTIAHAASDPDAVDAARVRTTQDALHRSMPDDIDAPAEVARASDSIASGEMPEVRPISAEIGRDAEIGEPVRIDEGTGDARTVTYSHEDGHLTRDTVSDSGAIATKDRLMTDASGAEAWLPAAARQEGAAPKTFTPEDARAAMRGDLASMRPAAGDGSGVAAAPAPRSQGTNALPPRERVTIEPEAKATKGEPVQTPHAARVTQLAEESPHLTVQLPGSERTQSITEAMESAKAEHELDSGEADLVKAALDCALGFGA